MPAVEYILTVLAPHILQVSSSGNGNRSKASPFSDAISQSVEAALDGPRLLLHPSVVPLFHMHPSPHLLLFVPAIQSSFTHIAVVLPFAAVAFRAFFLFHIRKTSCNTPCSWTHSRRWHFSLMGVVRGTHSRNVRARNTSSLFVVHGLLEHCSSHNDAKRSIERVLH